MMTPQEVASHAFAKATLGGYHMGMVDEFLDLLTEDYTALYNDNAILKNKLKVLSDTVEEYRATDVAMRKTLLAAQQMADNMVKEAEKKQAELLGGAEVAARERLAEVQKQIAAEEQRLAEARRATAAYVEKVNAAGAGLASALAALKDLAGDVPAEPVGEAPIEEEKVFSLFHEESPNEEAVPASVEEEEPEADPTATRRFENLQFGKDYEIR